MNWVVFDLDHTLLTTNSSFCFGAYLYRQNFFSFKDLLLSLTDYARHKWLGMSTQTLHMKSFDRLFKGQSATLIRQYVDKFLTDQLESLLYAPVIKRLKAAQNRHDRVIILSSSPDFLVKEISRRLNVKNWKSTEYMISKEEKFYQIAYVMEGEDKANYIKNLAKQESLSLSDLTVYSDSYLDFPLLKIAGQAIGVKPDNDLKRICLQKGWEIL